MAALDFPSAPTLGQQYTAGSGATYVWDGAVWTALGSTPPGGPAGGDLTGTYPNPQVAPGAVAWGEIAGAPAIPTTLPPSGPAGGSLAGSYPSPTLAASGVTAGAYGSAGKIPRVTVTAEGRLSAVSELDVAPTGGTPSGPAGGALAGTYPNPTLAATAVTPGTYGTQYKVAQLTVGADGRLTAVLETTIRARWG